MICKQLTTCADTCLYSELNVTCNRKNCIELRDKRSKVTCKERASRYTFLNTRASKVVLYHMDGGIVADNNVKKCDYCLLTDNNGMIAVLIELKGTDIPHAIEQILKSIEMFNPFFPDANVFMQEW